VARVWTSAAVAPQPAVRTTDLVYLRFHGLGDEQYRHDYTDAELRPWVEEIRAALEAGATAHVYFNNDYDGHAVTNAKRFSELLAGAGG
jgi:uncharacterized protein YecE (DUF72 family)